MIETGRGSYVWDCAAFISLALVGHLKSLKSPLRAMAISHPHVSHLSLVSFGPTGMLQFFTTSLTWSRALGIPIYLCETDKEWYQRLNDIKPEDDIRWFTDEAVLGKGVTVIQCGGSVPPFPF